MEGKKKRIVTGIWIAPNADALEEFFIRKGIKEKELGRILTQNEAHELMVEYCKEGKIQGTIIEKDPKDVRAIITEHYNVWDPCKKKRRGTE